MAGASTVSQGQAASFGRSSSIRRVTLSMCWHTWAHWKKWPLCRPERNTKWPVNKAFESRKIWRTSSWVELMLAMA